MNPTLFGIALLIILVAGYGCAWSLATHVARMNIRRPQQPLMFGLAVAYALMALVAPGIRLLSLPDAVNIFILPFVMMGMPVLGFAIVGISGVAFVQSRIGLFAVAALIGLIAFIGFWLNFTTNWIWPYRAD